MASFSKILVAVDFSDDSAAALEMGMRLARGLSAELHIVHSYRLPVEVFSPYGLALPASVMPEIRRAGEEGLRQEVERAAQGGVEAIGHLREGPAAEAIAETARDLGADLLVLGTRGRTGLAHVVLGSVAERTLRIAPCPVLTVKAKPA